MLSAAAPPGVGRVRRFSPKINPTVALVPSLSYKKEIDKAIIEVWVVVYFSQHQQPNDLVTAESDEDQRQHHVPSFENVFELLGQKMNEGF